MTLWLIDLVEVSMFVDVSMGLLKYSGVDFVILLLFQQPLKARP